MKLLLKNANLYNPSKIGIVDILIVDGKIIKIEKNIQCDCETIDCVGKIVAPMFAQIKANQIEIESLATLRDTLLPKLMSGEIDVSSIEV